MLKKIILFLVLNFTALAIGGLFTGGGVSSIWYQELSKAPWTPPGWAFGAAWTFIMICFAVYMAYLLKEENKQQVTLLFGIQWVLNVSWNPVFFYFQNVTLGLIVISALTVLVAYFFFTFMKTLKIKTAFIAPYLIWLLIATSLNGYILINN
jgi:tryptophan-rich sensory protein